MDYSKELVEAIDTFLNPETEKYHFHPDTGKFDPYIINVWMEDEYDPGNEYFANALSVRFSLQDHGFTVEAELPWAVKKKRRGRLREWINQQNETISEMSYSLEEGDYRVRLTHFVAVEKGMENAEMVSAEYELVIREIAMNSMILADLTTGEVFPSQIHKVPMDRPSIHLQ